MALATFYTPDLPEQATDIELSKEESQHAVRVRRLVNQAPVRVFDGLGRVGFGKLLVLERAQARVQIDSLERIDAAKPLCVASALPKGDRQRVMIDALCQLGVSHFVPLECERSIVKYQDKMALKWRRYAIEACKQSQNPFLIQCAEPLSIATLLELHQDCYYLDQAGPSMSSIEFSKESQTTLIVGPEGGFSDLEINALQSKAKGRINLGPHILRTELAAVVAAGLLHTKIM